MMTLRRRLRIALVGMLVGLAVALAAVGYAIHAHLLSQVDARLLLLAAEAKRVAAIVQRADTAEPAPASALVSDVWVGLSVPGGRLTTLQSPSSDAYFVPRVNGTEPLNTAVNAPTATGATKTARLVVAELSGNRRLLIAAPLSEVEATSLSLALALGLAWLFTAGVATAVVVWVERIGVRPIEHMTSLARAIAEGARRGDAPPDRADPGLRGTEAAELGLALNAMLDAQAAAAQQQRLFVADASHELRTPLTTLQGFTALYAAGALSTDAQVADAMRRMRGEATRMAGLVDGLLDLTTLDAGRPLNPIEIQVEPLLGDVAADLRAVAPGRPISVEAPELTVLADPVRLQQALEALGTNAVRHGQGRISLRALAEGAGVRFEVSDQGSGVPPEEEEAIFERFHRAAAAGTPGAGLGLPLVSAIAKSHGGVCGVTHDEDRRPTFWVWLPADGQELPRVTSPDPGPTAAT